MMPRDRQCDSKPNRDLKQSENNQRPSHGEENAASDPKESTEPKARQTQRDEQEATLPFGSDVFSEFSGLHYALPPFRIRAPLCARILQEIG
jgi:hypothetical protein